MESKRFLIAFAAAIPLVAADISGPVLGYVHRGGTLRPIIGIPGASYFGTRIDTGDLAIAGVSSSAGYAVAVTPDGQKVYVLMLRAGIPAQRLIPIDVAAATDSFVLSASGSALGIVRGAQVDVFTGLPSLPRKHRTLSLSVAPDSVAVSDDGDAVAILEGPKILSVFERDEARQIAANDLRHVSFRPATHELTYIDGDLVISVSRGISTLIAGAADGVSAAR